MIGPIFNDSQYQSLKAMLDTSAARHNALASNIANVNTPGYHRQDIDGLFKKELERAIQAKDIDGLKGMKPKIEIDEKTPSLRSDGNNVNLEREMVELTKNNTEYEVSATLLAKRYQMLRMAITGK